jgi:predicted dienelactone hydrolase
MRVFEVLIVLLALAGIIVFVTGATRRWIGALAAASATVAVLHAALEGCRWQMIPAYGVLAALLIVAAAAGFRVESRRKSRGWLAVLVAGVLVLAFGAVLSFYVLPVFSLEEPTGPYVVGTTSRHLVDPSREETYTPDPADRRELMVQIWYPAEPDPSPVYERYPEEMRNAAARNLNLPVFVAGHLGLVATHSIADAPLSDDQETYPVLLFSHGIRSSRFQNIFQVEELASHGYIVVAIDHPYDAAYTRFPDGRVADLRVESPMTTDAGVNERQVGIRVEDARFVLGWLEEPGEPFGGRLDLDRVGFFGHSYGGATVTWALAVDPRFKAGINMDGPVYGPPIASSPTQPFLFMFADQFLFYTPSDEQIEMLGMDPTELERITGGIRRDIEQTYRGMGDDASMIMINGTNHLSFSDASLYSGIVSPEIDPHRAHRIINDYTLAFFDTYLRGRPSAILNGSDPAYPEVQFVEPPIPVQ